MAKSDNTERYPHDASYKLLFSHPDMVRDLLIGFVNENRVKELDFNTLEAVKNSFVSVSDQLDNRDEDLIWRVRWKDRWLYLYILLAFQSSPDRFMAIRTMVYMGLLYQHIIRTDRPKRTDKLPPVLPIVLYNGQERWTSLCSAQDLIRSVDGFQQYCPKLSCFLLGEKHYEHLDKLDDLKNLVAAVFQPENSRTSDDMRQVVKKLLAWLTQPEQDSLRRSFAM